MARCKECLCKLCVVLYRLYISSLLNLPFNLQVVTQGGRRLSAYKTSVDQSDAGDHTRSAGEELSTSNLIVVRTDKEDVSDHIPGFLVLA